MLQMVITESAVNVNAMPTDRTRIEQIVPAEHNDDSGHDVNNREGDRSAISALPSSPMARMKRPRSSLIRN